MINHSQWGQHDIHFTSKKVHSKPIISISPHDQNLFFTSAQDNTLRLWDLRLHSSVKLFRNQALQNITNCQSDKKSMLFVGAGQHVYSFDTRKQGIFVQQILARSEEAHFDDVSFIRVDSKEGTVGVSDDEGDVRLYNFDLECTQLFDQGHNNIVNAIQLVNVENGKLCITGGFDCRLVHWKLGQEDIVREIDLQELFNKHEVNASTMPFIYSIYLFKTTLYVTTETGHVIAFPVKDIKKPKYILEASLARVVQAKVPTFNQNLLVTLCRDGSFSFFDHTKRFKGAPVFLQKYKCKEQGNWLDTLQTTILVSNCNTPQLSFYTVK